MFSEIEEVKVLRDEISMLFDILTDLDFESAQSYDRDYYETTDYDDDYENMLRTMVFLDLKHGAHISLVNDHFYEDVETGLAIECLKIHRGRLISMIMTAKSKKLVPEDLSDSDENPFLDNSEGVL